MPESLKQQSMRGILWSFLNRSSNQIVMFVVSIVLARLLSPEDFGVIALANVTIGLVTCFSNLGLGVAIVQKKEVDNLDYSTFFWADSFIRLLVYSIIYIISPYVAIYYDKPALCAVTRVIAIGVPIGIISSVPGLQLTRSMNFKTPALISVISCICSSVVALGMALKGCGVWTVVGQSITLNLVGNVLTFWKIPWKPLLVFSWQRFLRFFNFGCKMLVSGILDTFYGDLTSIIIGKYFSLSSLGYYTKGQNIPTLIVNSVNVPINGVSFPMLSKLQDNKEKYRVALSKALQTSLFFVAPMMVGLLAVAEPLILLLFGEKWLPAVPFLRIMAVVYVLYPLHTLNLNAIISLGRSDIFLKLEIIKKISGLLIMLVALPFGLMPFIYSKIISTIVSLIINAYPLKNMINYSLCKQVRDLSRTFLGSIVMLLFVLPLQFLPVASWIRLSLQIIIGILIYFVYSLLFNKHLLLGNILLLHNTFARKKQ